MRPLLNTIVAAALVQPALAWACWDEAADRYGVSADLLYAIARVESSLNHKAVNRSHAQRTGSYDIGLMQINSRHLRRLGQYGISEADLYDPCVNLHVGAWLLSDLMARMGNNWNAVGAYNAACTQLKGDACLRARARYSWLVYRQLPGHQQIKTTASPGPASTAPGIRARVRP